MRKKLFLTSAAVLPVATLAKRPRSNRCSKVIDETYVQPEYVLGSSLTEDQKIKHLKNLAMMPQKIPKI